MNDGVGGRMEGVKEESKMVIDEVVDQLVCHAKWATSREGFSEGGGGAGGGQNVK